MPLPKSRHKEALQGKPGRRPIRPPAPKLGKRTPRLPPYLTGEAKAIWKKTVRDMRRLKILDRIDEDILGQYCMAQANMLRAAKNLRTAANFVERNKPSVWFQIYSTEASRVARLADKLGMTPYGRRRLDVDFAEEGPADPYTEFRKGKVKPE